MESTLNITPSLERRFWAKVEKTDSCWNWTAWQTNGYGRFSVGGRQRRRRLMAHRIAWIIQNGPIPEGMVLDHTCHNTLCVNPRHLRIVSQKQNMENLRGPHRDNKGSGIRNVYRDGTRWRAQIKHNGVAIYLGMFSTIAEAEKAAISGREQYFNIPAIPEAA